MNFHRIDWKNVLYLGVGAGLAVVVFAAFYLR
jgi:hypothetical protein